MDHFHYHQGRLKVEGLHADDLADRFGTPLYVYSARTFREHYTGIRDAFAELDPLVCYSIKSCGNVHLVRMLAEMGSGMDVVSGGELHRAKVAGADMSKVVYAGVGKSDAEIRQALDAGIGWFNVESEAEFENIARLAAEMGVTTRAALRVNPDVVDARTHDKTTTGAKETKFGVDLARARRFFDAYGHDPHVRLDAIHLHIGSPIYSPEPYVNAIQVGLELIDDVRAAGHTVHTIDIGGGYAADYVSGRSPSYRAYADAIVPLLKDKGLQVILEPGRTIAGNAGVLLTTVEYTKVSDSAAKTFIIVDTGMHHLLRPSMYDAFHFMWPTRVEDRHVPPSREEQLDLPGLEPADVVGPICETADSLAKARNLPPMRRGNRLAIFTAGAYGMVMASHYNAHPLPAEVLVDGQDARLIRRRETYDDLLAAELELDAAAV
jgi:diaminopimelate decarboxylase